MLLRAGLLEAELPLPLPDHFTRPAWRARAPVHHRGVVRCSALPLRARGNAA